MINKKRDFIFGIVFLLSVLLIVLIPAQEVSYCCEKTMAGGPGGFCVNAPLSQCNTTGDLRAVPTSCEATSYCKTGTCVNTAEGICFENTPRKTCVDPEGGESGGVWYDADSDEIPLCQLGCCLIGDQAAFVTQTRCQELSSSYGLEINFRTDIRDELTCIASATPKAKGACVFETSTGRTCTFITKSECQDMKAGNPSADFHQGLLCSNPSLGADCSSSSKTICVEGRDEVYFLDTCGNLANVYDYSKLDVQSYWEKIIAPDCGSGSNADSKICGDCSYYLGSTCGEYRRGIDEKPQVGNYLCRDLSCKGYEGEGYTRSNPPKHGETWCAEAKGIDTSLPGSRYFRLVCYNGDVSVEPCADFRQEICIQSSVGGFNTAACRVNKWQDCYSQDNEDDCENIDRRDCEWETKTDFCILKDENGVCLTVDNDGNEIKASCVPSYAPGFDFWEEDTDAESMCSMASTVCIVDYEDKIGKDPEVVKNEECYDKCIDEGGGKDNCEKACMPACAYENSDDEWEVDEDKWAEEMNEMCVALGDCGMSMNYINRKGYYDLDNFITRS